jgi:sugar lactone lactonase YvrE
VVGETYVGEPVPTDIEIGADGSLWVTTLGGGFGEQMPLGHLYTLDPDTGAVTGDVPDFLTPVGVALDGDGNAFVSQLFANTVMEVPAGSDTATAFREPSMPAALEYAAGRLWATTNVLAQEPPLGKIVSWQL